MASGGVSMGPGPSAGSRHSECTVRVDTSYRAAACRIDTLPFRSSKPVRISSGSRRARAPSHADGTSSLARCQSVEGGSGDVHALLDVGDGDAVVVEPEGLSQGLWVDLTGSTERLALARCDVPGDVDTFARIGDPCLLDEAQQCEGEFGGWGERRWCRGLRRRPGSALRLRARGARAQAESSLAR
jgi:hypothetical protein